MTSKSAGKLRRDPKPLYRQVQALIVDDITNGIHPPGSKMPTEDELASQLGVSRPTVRQALGNLEMSGYVRRVHGGGTFVTEPPIVIDNPLDKMEPLHPDLTGRMGFTSHLTDLTVERVEADEMLARRMHRPAGTSMTRIGRVVVVRQTPIAYLVDLVPEDLISLQEVRDQFTDNVVNLLEDRGAGGEWYEMSVTAGLAQPPVSDLLKVSNGRVLITFDGDFVTDRGDLVHSSLAHFLPGSVRLTARRRVNPSQG